MKDKNLFELGKLAQQGNDMAMLEIIERKKKMIKMLERNSQIFMSL